ncbi:MAG: hypothetical protein RL095_1421 [Verrucomicrobiota bacterium]|jgi:hypothetical protein
MIRILALPLLLLGFQAAPEPPAPAPAASEALVALRGPKTLVVYGSKASPEEQQLAALIAEPLVSVDLPLDDVLKDDEYYKRFSGFYADYTLIVVGSAASNSLIAQDAVSPLPERRFTREGFFPAAQELGTIDCTGNKPALHLHNLSGGAIQVPAMITIKGSRPAEIKAAAAAFLAGCRQGSFPVAAWPQGDAFLPRAGEIFLAAPEDLHPRQLRLRDGEAELFSSGWGQVSLSQLQELRRCFGPGFQSCTLLFDAPASGHRPRLLGWEDLLVSLRFADPQAADAALARWNSAAGLGLKLEAPGPGLRSYRISLPHGDALTLVRHGSWLVVARLPSSLAESFLSQAQDLFVKKP